MQKKLQVFISSTYTDLHEERQAAVQAVLSARHIPAGMELFQAGDESQLETIKRWIDESDVYCLILGGRYGSIEPESGKSYTHVEYEYALAKGMPVFAVVISEQALNEKVSKLGMSGADEREYPEKYKEFKTLVLSKMCRFFNNTAEVKLAIIEKLLELQSRHDLSGWISGSDVPDLKEIADRVLFQTEENAELRKTVERLQDERKRTENILTLSNGLSYEAVRDALNAVDILIRAGRLGAGKDSTMTLLRAFDFLENVLATGIKNTSNMSEDQRFVYFTVAPQLMTYGLVEAVKEPQGLQRLRTSKDGHKFLSKYRIGNILLEKE